MRKEWNFNPRKSIGKRREGSREGRPKVHGMRINRQPIVKSGSIDPILALL